MIKIHIHMLWQNKKALLHVTNLQISCRLKLHGFPKKWTHIYVRGEMASYGTKYHKDSQSKAWNPGEGTPSMLGDMDVPPFWPPFLTFWGLNSIFLGYFFSSTNTKTIFWGIKTTNSYRIRSFRPQISFFPRSFWVQFSAASGTPPSVFGPSTPPGLKHPCVPS